MTELDLVDMLAEAKWDAIKAKPADYWLHCEATMREIDERVEKRLPLNIGRVLYIPAEEVGRS